MAPRRPRRPRPSAAVGYISGAKQGMATYERLTKQFEKLRREADRIAAQQQRIQARMAREAQRVGQEASDEALDQLATQQEVYQEQRGAQPRTPTGGLPPLMPWAQPEESTGETAVEDVLGPQLGPVATEWYVPTKTINPGRPRTLQMSYDRETRVLRVFFRDGGAYDYSDVPGDVWYRIRRVQSPGRFIDRNIRGVYDYNRVSL